MGGYKMGSINYSIIIPHKNCPDLLQRCLNSIPVVPDIQIIIVDDNSDNDIVDFNNFPGKERINTEIYFTKEGKGAGYARNIGLEHVKGKWVLFLDSDDILTDNCLNNLDSFCNNNDDIIYFKLVERDYSNEISIDKQNFIDFERGNSYNQILNTASNYIPYLHYIPVGKMIKTSTITDNNIRFDEVSCSNDVMFFTRLAPFVKKFTISNKYLYCITKPTGRNLTSRKDYFSGKTRLNVLLERNSFLKKRGLQNLRTPPLLIIWQFRNIGLLSLFKLIYIIMKSDTCLFLGIDKFIKSPRKYLKVR